MQVHRNTAQLLVSMEVVPMRSALLKPCGRGRSAPNAHPTLPTPVGRLKLRSLISDPWQVLQSLVGPGTMRAVAVLAVAGVALVVLLVGMPYADALLNIFLKIPYPYNWVGVGVALGLIVSCCCCCCYACCHAHRQINQMGTADHVEEESDDDGDDAADEGKPLL